MTNNSIICNEAIANHVYSQAEIEEFLEMGQLPPLHTATEWAGLGYRLKRGEHPCITTKLWVPAPMKAGQDEAEEETRFLLVTAHLFDEKQVERYLEVTA